MAESARITIEPWTDADLELLRQANAPEMTLHLGGPESEEKVLARHQRYVRGDDYRGQMFSVRLLPGREPVGTVGYWEKEWQGDVVYEVGWGVLPAYQGRGIAAAATAAVVEQARADGNRRFVHAFPSIDNAASNAVCRKSGFTLVAEMDFEYPKGNPITCNDWRLDLKE